MIWIMYRQLSDDAPAVEQANWMIESFRSAVSPTHVSVVEYGDSEHVLTNLNRGDVVFFRNIGSAIRQCNAIIARAVSVGAFIVDPYLRNQFTNDGIVHGARSKMKSQEDMLASGVATPATTLITLRQFINEEHLGVIKTVRGGRQGNGTYSYLTSDQQRKGEIVTDIMSKPRQGEDGLLVQEYIPNRGDIRVVTIGYEPVAIMKRKPKHIDSLKFDTSIGTSKAIASPKRDVVELARLCSRSLGIAVCSMDIVRSTINDLPYVVDVNESPTVRIISLRTRTNIPQLIVNYLNSIHDGEVWARSTL